MRSALLVLTALLAGEANACPTIATGTPSSLNFDTAQVIFTYVNGRVTFSVSINPAGDPQDFALVLPVPEILAADEIRTLSSQLFIELDGYTAPREVADAGCGYQDYVPCPETDSDADTDADTDSDGDGDSGVDVEANYHVGSYDISILSAEESTGLNTWLDTNGYYLPDGAEERLAEYIDAGSYFLVAKVSPEATAADGSPLMPLQVSYDAEFMSIPIRLAALSAIEAQDMVLYTIVDANDGRVGLANYPEFTVPDTCVWGTEDPFDFGADQAALFDKAFSEVGTAAWTTEFSQYAGDCNPCTNYNPFYYYDGDFLSEVGFVGPFSSDQAGWPWITRLHMRYDRDTAGADLMLYASNMQTTEELTYADNTDSNRDCIEYFCDGTRTDPPPATVYEDCTEDSGTPGGDGGGDGTGGDGAADGLAPHNGDPYANKGCSTTRGGAGLGLGLLGLSLLLRRRR